MKSQIVLHCSFCDSSDLAWDMVSQMWGCKTCKQLFTQADAGFSQEDKRHANTDHVIAITHCARCGHNHNLEVYRFQRPIEDSDGTVWDSWGLCEVTGEPVLVKSTPVT